jgi:H+-translocating NAD(P) transhydrogenase subunit alpha
MKIGILKEPIGENRVAVLPELIPDLLKLSTQVLVESGAGMTAFADDQAYKQAGAEIVSREQAISQSDLLLFINSPDLKEFLVNGTSKVLMGIFNVLNQPEVADQLASSRLTSFSLDLIPRSTRAQAMDILSSMATVAGYKAVLDAANHLPAFFPMFMSAAGTIRPAKVLILGAGVAGLQAIATSRKLGAVVEVFDVRSAVKEEVKSLGGKFIEVEGAKEDAKAGGYAVEQTEEFKEKQKQLIHDHASKANVIICTAQIPGRKAPVLIEKRTVEAMIPGSVIIDLAASTGGNCAVTKNRETVELNGVKIIGNSDYPSDLPTDASRMFGKNLLNFLKLFFDQGKNFNLNFGDDIIKGTCLTHEGEIVNERFLSLIKK